MDFMKSGEYKIFIKYRIPELDGQLKSEQYDSKTGIGVVSDTGFCTLISMLLNHALTAKCLVWQNQSH